MEWLTENKIPVGKAAASVFDWLQINGAFFFDALSDILEAMIDAILWVLQTPNPFFIIAAFTLLAFVLQRSWKPALLTFLGFVFILNQGYWEETSESLTLVLSACVVCMGVGVPIGIAMAHRPRLYAWARPVLDLMQTLPTFVPAGKPFVPAGTRIMSGTRVQTRHPENFCQCCFSPKCQP